MCVGRGVEDGCRSGCDRPTGNFSWRWEKLRVESLGDGVARLLAFDLMAYGDIFSFFSLFGIFF